MQTQKPWVLQYGREIGTQKILPNILRLMIHSLEDIPQANHRDYYIYCIDYGWDESLSEVFNSYLQQ